MRVTNLHSRYREFGVLAICGLLMVATVVNFRGVSAQALTPVLISQETSTRALVFDSVTHQHEPFSSIAPVKFTGGNSTRIMLFAMNLKLQPGETVNVQIESIDPPKGEVRFRMV